MIGVLGIESSSSLARQIGCDRSMISRMRSGKLLCAPDSDFAQRLTEGLYECGEGLGTLDKAAELVGTDAEPGRQELCRRIHGFLFEGVPTDAAGRRRRRRKSTNAAMFCEMLNTVIDMASLSNIRLAQLASVDPSIISRYRNGRRIPVSGSAILESICRVLTGRIYMRGRAGDLAELLRFESVPEPDEACAELLRRLCEFEYEERPQVAGLVEDISSFVFPKVQPQSVSQLLTADESRDVYFGIEGIRTAAVRFLLNVIKSGAKEMLLYSDLDMEWMTADKEYAQRWALLMAECIGKGTKIKIIHNIDRSVEEMTDAIRAWLPLYMTGAIESYCSIVNAGRRFTHTIFLAPDCACVSSFAPRGAEENAVYRYITDKDVLGCQRGMFDELMAQSKPLVRITRADDAESGSGVKVTVNDDGVTVRRLSEPRLDFNIAHPLMRAAFEAYLK